MTQVIIDAETRAKLRGLSEPAVLCDESGRPLGYFTPQPAELLEPQVSDEELLRRERSDERRYTTDEVVAYLESL